MEELRARHKQEQKDLLGKITQKKKNATKKTRKGVNDECERLERELKERQEAEVGALESEAPNIDQLNISDEKIQQNGNASLGNDAVEKSIEPDAESTTTNARSKKPNRQKARLARRAAEQDAQVSAAEAEAAAMPDVREQELAAMKTQMRTHGLVETLVRPDGHCMYSACALTVPTAQPQTYQTVRTETANFIASHADDFAPFLEEPLQTYTTKIKTTAEWGGHLELQAIARAYHVQIHVLRANGHIEHISADTDTQDEIWLAYYQHSFGLGEHYNALKKGPPD